MDSDIGTNNELDSDAEHDALERVDDPAVGGDAGRSTEYVEDRAGDVGVGSAEHPDPQSSSTSCVSEKQLAANRRNAKRSTGPKTKKGKVASSANAMKHGVYGMHLSPIRRGPFREDPDEFVATVTATIEVLRPRDLLEHRVAQRIALALTRGERLDVVEAAAFETDTVIPMKRTVELGSAVYEQHLDDVVEALGEVVGEESFVPVPARGPQWDDLQDLIPGIGWAHLAMYVKDVAFEGKVRVPGVWDEKLVPFSNEEWRQALVAMLNNKWGTPAASAAWVRSQVGSRRLRDRSTDGRADGVAARNALTGSLPRVFQLRTANDRSLALQFALLEALQARDLNTSELDHDEDDDEQEDC
jgi:hypothetical protein